MHSGTTYFPDSIKVLDARMTPFIHEYTPAKIMSGRYDRYWLMRDVDTGFQTLAIDIGKAIANRCGRHLRCNVEQHVSIVVRLHLVMNCARDYVARSQLFPLR